MGMKHTQLGKCEDADKGCPVCHGHCNEWANITLFRVDMEDRTGTAFCERCAEDAMDAGVFTNYEPESVQV